MFIRTHNGQSVDGQRSFFYNNTVKQTKRWAIRCATTGPRMLFAKPGSNGDTVETISELFCGTSHLDAALSAEASMHPKDALSIEGVLNSRCRVGEEFE